MARSKGGLPLDKSHIALYPIRMFQKDMDTSISTRSSLLRRTVTGHRAQAQACLGLSGSVAIGWLPLQPHQPMDPGNKPL